MKKLLILFMLATLTVAGMAANRTAVIRTGYTALSMPLSLGASDTITTSATYTITVTNAQKYLQHQTFTTTLLTVSGSPSVAITAYGKVTSGGAWVQIGTPVTWTTSGNNPAEITSTAPLNYNYLKLEYVASGATQLTKVLTFEIKTANVFDVGSASAYVFGNGSGTVAINSSDWDVSTTGVMTGIGAITMNGLLTGTVGATITGAASNINASSNFATNIGTGTTNVAVTIGGASNAVVLNGNNLSVSAAGAGAIVGDADSIILNPYKTLRSIELRINSASKWFVDSTGNVNVAGIITPGGGIVLPNASPVIWAKGGATVTAATGTDKACSNGARWWTEVYIPYNVTLTGIAYLVGSVGGTDSVMVHLYNSAGTIVATSKHTGATHGAIVGTTAQFQSVAFTATYAATAGIYYAAVQFNGTTGRFRTYPIVGSKFIANTAAGTWDVAANITPGTTFVADDGPILMTY